MSGAQGPGSGDPTFQHMGAALGAAVAGAGGPLALADRLCRACVEQLDVDGAAISYVQGGSTRGTFGSSGELSRNLDELQFTFGEGPCLDAVRTGQPVFAPDLDDPDELRWPALLGAVRRSGVRAMFAMPVSLASSRVGALDLFRNQCGPLGRRELHGAMIAADLAALPLLDMITDAGDWDADKEMGDPWPEIASLERVEVYQATGMIMARLEVDATEALVRLRAYAAVRDLGVTEVAWAVIERRLRLDADDGWRSSGFGSPS